MRTLLALAVVVSLIALALSPTAPPASPTAASRAPEATGAWQAREWRRLAWLDEQGDIPENALQTALIQRDANLRAAAGRNDLPAPFAAGDWNELGPTNVSGRTRSLLIDPDDTDVLIAGSVSGGIFRSTNAGATWSPVDDFLPNLAVCCLKRCPHDADVLYAGTGEGFFNGDAIGGIGIFRSTDRGLSWSLMPGTSGWDNVNRVDVSPTDPDVILAARRFGGVYRTDDAGDTWSPVRPAQGSFDVDFHPTDGSKAIAHIIDFSGDWFHTALYSTDGGQTWTDAASLNTITGFGSRIELAYAPSDPTIVYASCGAAGGQLWKSTDGGQSYTDVTTSGNSNASWYYNPLWIDPTNPDFVLTGGDSIYKSTDGGQTLQFVSYGYMQESIPHADIHGFFSEPGFDGVNNRKVYVVTDGGVYRTNNIYFANDFTGWFRLDNQKLSTQFYGAAGDGPSGRIIGGTQDNGTLRITETNPTAALTFGGDGGFCAVDPTDPDYMYGEYVNLSIFRSTDGGQSGQYIYNNLGDTFSAANFIAPFVLDPNEPNRILAGGASLWRTDNAKSAFVGGITWTDIKPPVPSGSFISAIAVAPSDSDVVYVGHNNGAVYRSGDATVAAPAWADADGAFPNPLPGRYIARLVVDRADPDTVFAALGGFSGNNVWKSTDGGASWFPISGVLPNALPAAPVRGLAQHPLDSDWLYAGTEVGIFATTDGGQTWTTTNLGPATVSVDELVFMHNSTTLLAATHGRGLWTVETAVPAPTCVGDMDDDGDTDVFDFSTFTTAFGSNPSDINWKPEADLVPDGVIDVFDFAEFTLAFGCDVDAS